MATTDELVAASVLLVLGSHSLYHPWANAPTFRTIALTSAKPNVQRKRFRFGSVAYKLLEAMFHVDARPSRMKREQIALRLKTHVRRIDCWFTNRRAKERKESTL